MNYQTKSCITVGYSNTAFQNEKPPLASTSSGERSDHSSEHSDQPPPYEESAVVPATNEKSKGIEVVEDDEKILNVVSTVKPVNKGHPRKRQHMVLWSLQTGGLYLKVFP